MQTWQITVPTNIPLELQQWCRDVFAVVERAEEKASREVECDSSLYQDIQWLEDRCERLENQAERYQALLDAVCIAVQRDEDIAWPTRRAIQDARHAIMPPARKPVETVVTDKV